MVRRLLRRHHAEADGAPVYTADDLPDGEFGLYSKTEPIEAIRLDGPFTTETREGVVTTTDGWLALDSDGFPYPIAAEEFDQVYEPFGATETAAPNDNLKTKDPDVEDEATPPAADEEPVEMVKISPDEHFANMAAIHADDDEDAA